MIVKNGVVFFCYVSLHINCNINHTCSYQDVKLFLFLCTLSDATNRIKSVLYFFFFKE